MIKKIIGVILIAAAIISLSIAGFRFFCYQNEEAQYTDLKEKVVKPIAVFPGRIREQDESIKEDQKQQPVELDDETKTLLENSIDWNELKAINKDFVGWIRMEPGIDYPVMRGKTNDDYIHTNFNGEYAYSGSIFMESKNNADWIDRNTILYGHNMLNRSMFGNLRSYRDQQFAIDHPHFYIYTKDGIYVYDVMSHIVTYDRSDIYKLVYSDEDMEKYLETVKNSATYVLSSPTKSDRIVTLSTCIGDGSEREVVQGKLVKLIKYDGTSVPYKNIKSGEYL